MSHFTKKIPGIGSKQALSSLGNSNSKLSKVYSNELKSTNAGKFSKVPSLYGSKRRQQSQVIDSIQFLKKKFQGKGNKDNDQLMVNGFGNNSRGFMDKNINNMPLIKNAQSVFKETATIQPNTKIHGYNTSDETLSSDTGPQGFNKKIMFKPQTMDLNDDIANASAKSKLGSYSNFCRFPDEKENSQRRR
ncbi:unnamed protein product [Moneuplotes crassus]|uniref:Uncharacterized protein n=1 Tax=Euplotes crassus TaxID=5936 RepID=A0AAD2DA93_EUPCR|nr:unnamed protein product [Moneuplotes crassus]